MVPRHHIRAMLHSQSGPQIWLELAVMIVCLGWVYCFMYKSAEIAMKDWHIRAL